jgi:hypothetical protein
MGLLALNLSLVYGVLLRVMLQATAELTLANGVPARFHNAYH